MNEKDLQASAAILKALAHPLRLAVVMLLARQELCACDVAAAFPEADRTTVSRHLSRLTRLGVLESRRQGINIYYRLKMTCLPPAVECIARALRGCRCGSDAPGNRS